MLTGVTPFRAASVLETLDQVLHEDPHSPRQLHSGVPRDLDTICLKCLRKEPDRRYRSALDLAEDLRRFQADEPVLARPMGKLERGWRWCRRRPALAALLATVVVFMSALAVGAVVTSVWLHRERDLALRSEETALRSLRQSYLDQARLGRLNLSVGQRSRSLELLTEAARMMPGLDVRNETIACLARADWRPVREWAGNPLLCGVAFDGPLERYAHCGSDGTVTIRSALDDRELQRLDSIPLGSPPGIMVFSPKGRYLAGTCEVNREMKLIVWDLTNGRELLRLPSAPTGAAVAFAPQDDAVATAIQSKSIAVYEIPSGRERLRLEPVAAVDEIAFDAQGTRLALSSVSEKVAEVYDLESRRRTQRLEHPEGVRGIGWSANGKWLATGCDDTIVYVWDVAHARLQATLPGHRAPIIAAKFNEEDAGIVTGSWDGTCRWWDLETRQTVLSAPGSNVYLAEGGRRMALSDAERLSIWEQATPEIRRDLRPRSTAAEVPHIGRLSTRSLDTAPGALLAVASEDGVHIWNTRTLREACFLPLHECVIARFDPTGHYLAAIGDEGLFRWRYQLAQGEFKLGPREPLPVPINYRFAVGDLCWGPRGAYLLFSDYRVGKVRKVDLTGTPTVEDFGPLEHATSIARSPDGRWIASGAWQGEGLRIWDASSRKRITDIAGSRPGATSMRAIFSPDGGTLAACGQQEYRFLETGTWRLQRTLPRDRIESGPGPLAYHPDGRSLALVRTPGQVQILDRATYQELATLTNLDLISNLCFDADGSHLAVATAMNGLQWWDLKGLRAELERMGLNWED